MTATEEKKLVQRLNYGVVFRENGHVILSNEYWLHTYEVSIPEYVPFPNIGTCHKDNSTCVLIAHILANVNTVRAETSARLNNTIESIRELIPKAEAQKSRSRRSLLPFIGQFSKTLFGTATIEDVNVLAKHMNAMNQRSRKMASILAQHENDLSSFITKSNERMDNLMKGVQENNLAITYVQSQLQRSTRNLENMFQEMTSLLTQQVQTSNHINHALDELKLGVTNLVNGKLSPLLLPQSVLNSTFINIQNILNAKFPGFYLTKASPASIYSSSNFLYTRNESSLFITVKLPVSHFKDPLQVYNVISLPIPVNKTSTHATHLLTVPDNLILTSDHQFYATMSESQLLKCKGKDLKRCHFNIALKPITTHSCVLSLYANNKENVKSLCDFRFIPNAIKPQILELNPSSMVLYRTPILSLQCRNEHKMIKGCDFCVVQLPCQCSVISSEFYLTPRLTACHNHTQEVSRIHPVNLILLQHFFSNDYTSKIFGDTAFADPVNITIPHFKFYNHNMKNIMANDNRAHLSISKIAESVKNDKTIFQSLAEPLLDGEIAITPDWPATNDILTLAAMTISTVSLALVVFMVFKLRAMAATIAGLTQTGKVKALPTTLPSFIYKTEKPVIPNSEWEIFDFNVTIISWEHAIFAFLVLILVLLIGILFKLKSKNNDESKICIEITNTQKCIIIELATLPLCPSHCNVQVPASIVDIDVGGSFTSPTLISKWENFTITDTITNKVVAVPQQRNISILEAVKLSSIIKHPFFVYVYLRHHGSFEKLM